MPTVEYFISKAIVYYTFVYKFVFSELLCVCFIDGLSFFCVQSTELVCSYTLDMDFKHNIILLFYRFYQVFVSSELNQDFIESFICALISN